MRPDRGHGSKGGNTTSSGALARRTRRKGHGAFTRRVDGRLPERLSFLQAGVDAARVGLEADMGGDLSTAQRLLVESTLEAHIIRRLLGHNLLSRGATTRKGELRPAAKSYVAFLNSERLGLLALGLRRRAKSVPTLDAHLAALEKARGGSV